ncbi:MAG: 4-alpha-glucanotransferase [Chthoniobacterales bacterium]
MPDLHPDQKIAGLVAPVFALRGSEDLGIGDTAALEELGVWAASQGLRIVQVLPINESGGDNSPYNVISSMALDPVTIATTPSRLPDLTKTSFRQITADHDLGSLRTGTVDYAAVRALKRDLLTAAHARFDLQASAKRRKEFAAFIEKHRDWLEPYALYRSLIVLNGGSEVLHEWPARQRNLKKATAWFKSLKPAERNEIEALNDFHRYVQWVAYSQWRDVRARLAQLDVSIMGDIPVGVSIYSCDVWSEPDEFDLTRSSGAPPEQTFQTDPFITQWGQNWGFPLYDWDAMARNDYAWWRRRLRGMFETYDLVRVDHALGFYRIYSFPWRPEDNAKFLDLSPDEAKALTGGRLPGFVPFDDNTPAHREKNRQQGEQLFQLMLEETGEYRLVVEDLGTVPPYVRPSLIEMEIPGFKIPQWERHPDGKIILGNEYQRLSLACYATHDHPPVRAFWTEWHEQSQSSDPHTSGHARWEMSELLRFADRPDLLGQPYTPKIHEALLRGVMASNSWLCVPMITDLLGTDHRFNVPGAIGAENWTCRLPGTIAELSADFASEFATLRKVLKATKRSPK